MTNKTVNESWIINNSLLMTSMKKQSKNSIIKSVRIESIEEMK